MFCKTPRAAVWVAPPSPIPSAVIARPAHRPDAAARILWSERPFAVSSGLCLGVQLNGGTLMVAFRSKASPTRLDWVSATQVLSSGEAERWSKLRFTSR